MARHVRHPKRLASGMGVYLTLVALTPWDTLGPLVTCISFETVGDVGAFVTVLGIFVWRALLAAFAMVLREHSLSHLFAASIVMTRRRVVDIPNLQFIDIVKLPFHATT